MPRRALCLHHDALDLCHEAAFYAFQPVIEIAEPALKGKKLLFESLLIYVRRSLDLAAYLFLASLEMVEFSFDFRVHHG
jgi:hypothetical protein